MEYLWIYVFSSLIVGVICAFIAKKINTDKGRTSNEGFLYGFFLGVIGIVVVALLPVNESEISQAKIAEGVNKKCPYCAEIIKSEAVVCRFCGREQPEKSITEDNKVVEPQPKVKKPFLFLEKVLICSAGFGAGAIIAGFLFKPLATSIMITSMNLFPVTEKTLYILMGIPIMIYFGILGVCGGIALGIIHQQEKKRWILTSLLGFIIGSLLTIVVFILLRRILPNFYFSILLALIMAIPIAYEFSSLFENWSYFILFETAGSVGFIFLFNLLGFGNFFTTVLDEGFKSSLQLVSLGVIGGLAIGICYGLVFALPNNLIIAKKRPSGE